MSFPSALISLFFILDELIGAPSSAKTKVIWIIFNGFLPRSFLLLLISSAVFTVSGDTTIALKSPSIEGPYLSVIGFISIDIVDFFCKDSLKYFVFAVQMILRSFFC